MLLKFKLNEVYIFKIKIIKMDEYSDCEVVKKDLLINQLKEHIKEMEKNEQIFERLNNKFINLQNE